LVLYLHSTGFNILEHPCPFPNQGFCKHCNWTQMKTQVLLVLIKVKLLKVVLALVLPLYMGVAGLVCSHFLMLGKAPTIATRADMAGHPVKSLSSMRAFGWLGRGTFMELTNW